MCRLLGLSGIDCEALLAGIVDHSFILHAYRLSNVSIAFFEQNFFSMNRIAVAAIDRSHPDLPKC